VPRNDPCSTSVEESLDAVASTDYVVGTVNRLLAIYRLGTPIERVVEAARFRPDDFRPVWESIEDAHELARVAVLVGVDQKALVLAACGCARSVLHLVETGEERPRLAIEAAEKWTEEGTPEAHAATIAAADAAAATADAADAATAAAYAAYAAYYAADAANTAAARAAAYAASTASAARAARAAYAADAADAANTAANTAAARAAAYAAYAASAASAARAAYAADLLRSHLPWETVLAGLVQSPSKKALTP